ncbi:MAG TPA: DUF2188 domain-containing protein [Xanthobacteraceae bacterium]|jgi:hypothetical protein|nr:DUF2188 domain-containing protein [Xanthobacteraceae bacterium]
MARPQLPDRTSVQPIFHSRLRKLYWIERQEDVWFIRFDGTDYGPYNSEREAMLFAVDAANKLGEQGDETQVLVKDEYGDVRPVWTFGHDSYPPRL